MNEFKKLMVNNINSSPIWLMLENNFNEYYKNKDKTDIIPKKIHQVWLGSKIPEQYTRLRETWMKKKY